LRAGLGLEVLLDVDRDPVLGAAQTSWGTVTTTIATPVRRNSSVAADSRLASSGASITAAASYTQRSGARGGSGVTAAGIPMPAEIDLARSLQRQRARRRTCPIPHATPLPVTT
jgi:hypothetical protein